MTRARHPVIEEYVAGRRPLKMLQALPEPVEPVLVALRKIYEALDDSSKIREAINFSQQVNAADTEASLLVLWYSLWAYISARSNRLLEADALLRRADQLCDEGVPAEVLYSLRAAKGVLASVRGDKRQRLELLRQERESTALNPTYRKMAFVNYALFMAQLGRGGEIEAEVDAFVRTEGPLAPTLQRFVALVRLVTLVESGRLQGAEQFLPEVTKGAGHLEDVAATEVSALKLMGGNWRPPEGAPTEPGDRAVAPDFPCWQMSTWCLLQRRAESALGWARLHTARWPARQDSHGLDSRTMVRAELACGHGDAARRFLAIQSARTYHHYLDGFFTARAELLAGREDLAARHFAAVQQACEHQRAEPRLDFELRLALELSPGQIRRLSRLAAVGPEQPPRSAEAAAPEEVEGASEDAGDGRIIGPSPAMAEVRRAVARFASLDAPVLITGETGTGKELVARALHEEGSRRGRPFVAVNCGAIAESLLESELFGHERGAFTGAVRAHRGFFEAAAAGTILLDEIGEMPPRLQVALLRVIETGMVRPVGSAAERAIACRIVAATNADLGRMTAEGRFRPDLLFRLKRLEIAIPPLRERPADILPLANRFLSTGRREADRPAMSEDLKQALAAYSWPGNVRELRNCIERMRLLNSDALHCDLTDSLRAELRLGSGPAPGPVPREDSAPPAEAPPGEDADSFILGGRSRLRRLDRARELFVKHGKLTRVEFAAVLKISPKTATEDLRLLCAEGFIRKIQPTAAPRTHYFAIAAHRS
jgi:DNA-binding NtrC family response regulator